MRSSGFSAGSAAAAALFLAMCVALIATATCHVEAKSSGVLSACDLTPVVDAWKVSYPNGCFGYKPHNVSGVMKSMTCANNGIMYWVAGPSPNVNYTLRSSNVGLNPATDPTTYIPGGTLNELHLRTFDLGGRIVGTMLYATNGTDPKTKLENHIGTWTVLPAQGGTGYQVSASCGYTAVTHQGADVKPLHSRFFWAAPVGSGTVRFRILLKIGGQGTGYFWYPAKELSLKEGVAPPPLAVNTPPVYGYKMINGTSTAYIVVPAVQVPITPLSGSPVIVKVLGALGQACTDACYAQASATPYCHAAALTAITDETSFLSNFAGLIDCDLPVLGMCPYSGAPRATTGKDSKRCQFRSMDIAHTCAPWAQAAIAAAAAAAKNQSPAATITSLFANGSSNAALRKDPAYVPDVCHTAPGAASQNLCICSNDPAHETVNIFAQAAIDAVTINSAKAARKVALANVGNEESAASSRVSETTFALLLVLVSSACAFGSPRSSNSKMSFFLLLAVVLSVLSLTACPVSAHNFMVSLHRATEAAVVGPCQPRVGNQPHVQIAPGQVYETMWTNGHGTCCGNTYFMTIAASAYQQLAALNITAIMQDYLNEAPSLRSDGADAAMWDRHHLARSDQPTPPQYWREPGGMPSTDPAFIQVDPVFAAKSHPSKIRPQDLGTTKTVVQTRFADAYKPADRRAAYLSAKYPWIESVDEFPHAYNVDLNPLTNPDVTRYGDFYSHDGDIARFNFTARSGPGDYITFYTWSGYRDCVDISVIDTVSAVSNRYGAPNSTSDVMVKVDHCEVRYVQQANTPMRLIDRTTRDVSACVADCLSLTSTDCTYVQVVRRTNPKNTLKRTPNIPWNPTVYNRSGVVAWLAAHPGIAAPFGTWPCYSNSSQNLKDGGCTRDALAQCKSIKGNTCTVASNKLGDALSFTDPAQYPSPQDDDFFCYGTVQYVDSVAQVYESYVTATDPMDPVWYSTCYIRTLGGGFQDIPPIAPPAPVWQADTACVNCTFFKQQLQNDMNQVTFWEQGLVESGSNDMCTDCSLLLDATATMTDGLVDLDVGADVFWGGVNGAAKQALFASKGGDPNDPYAAISAASEPSTAGEGDAPSASSSSAQLMGMKQSSAIIVIVMCVLAVVILVVIGLKVCAAKQSSASALKHMAGLDNQFGAQLTSNPASFTKVDW